MKLTEKLGKALATYLAKPGSSARVATCSPENLASTIKKGDVLLIDGDSRISSVIKYLTQSTWSHAALCVADNLTDSNNNNNNNPEQVKLIEADVVDGVREVPLSTYTNMHTRICRPVGLLPEEIDAIIAFSYERIGHQYDLKNIFDLARYLISPPVIPQKWRRRLLAIGSGDPTQAICSSLIAQAFQSVKYPILPEIIIPPTYGNTHLNAYKELLHIRHHSLFAPRDFDISPYFQIIKPTLSDKFDPHTLVWINFETEITKIMDVTDK